MSSIKRGQRKQRKGIIKNNSRNFPEQKDLHFQIKKGLLHDQHNR